MTQININPDPPPFATLAAILSYLVPGLGQIVQGRVGKGLLFMVCLLGLFHAGEWLGDWKNVYMPVIDKSGQLWTEGRGQVRTFNAFESLFNRWQFAGQFFIGAAAWPAIMQYYDKAPTKDEHPFWHEYQRGVRSYEDEAELNNQTTNSDKAPDVGWIYTVIAGVLNILVIFDAYSGPAYGAAMTRPKNPAQEPALT